MYLANTHSALISNDLFVVVIHPYCSISLEINSSVTFTSQAYSIIH